MTDTSDENIIPGSVAMPDLFDEAVSKRGESGEGMMDCFSCVAGS